jgi:hypothetical protein
MVCIAGHTGGVVTPVVSTIFTMTVVVSLRVPDKVGHGTNTPFLYLIRRRQFYSSSSIAFVDLLLLSISAQHMRFNSS